MAHKDDCPDQAITNKYILRWSENDDIRPKIREDERDAYFANTVHTGYSAIGYSAILLPYLLVPFVNLLIQIIGYSAYRL